MDRLSDNDMSTIADTIVRYWISVHERAGNTSRYPEQENRKDNIELLYHIAHHDLPQTHSSGSKIDGLLGLTGKAQV